MMPNKFFKVVKILSQEFYYSRTTRENHLKKRPKSIGIFVWINPESKKFRLWHDGFTKAVAFLSSRFENVGYVYFDPSNPAHTIEKLNRFDWVIVKSGWRTDIDYFLRRYSKKIKPALAMMISSSNWSPCGREQEFYASVWYETNWYKAYGVKHPYALHAFGIDTSVMKKKAAKKKYDWIAVGVPRKYKRLEKLISKEGTKLYVGDLKNTDPYSMNLLELFNKNDVEIRDFVSYEELADLYNQSNNCYVPCKLHGGGERSVLEARACGINVEIEDDNPKLKELLSSDIWDENYYGVQLLQGIEMAYLN